VKNNHHSPKPRWLRQNLLTGAGYERTRALLRREGLTTVCREARCPNIRECFSRHTATLMILGDRCTRDCRFCAVATGTPNRPDWNEPARVARAAKEMNLRYVVVTSVTRDDLPDGGASLFAAVIRAVKEASPGAAVEVLVPDFAGDREALDTVLEAGPAVLNHNVETVPRLYPSIRRGADYRRSLALLEQASRFGVPTKTGLMLGLGEWDSELEETLRNALEAGTRILTLGQYLKPAPDREPVSRYVPPEEFDRWKDRALRMGFAAVASGPFVRSSYDAAGLRDLYLRKGT